METGELIRVGAVGDNGVLADAAVLLCLDEGVGTIIWSPLARGRLARAWDDARSTVRSETDGAYADLLHSPAQEASDRAIIDAVGQVADAHGVSRAPVALAWLHRRPVVTAPLVGAGSIRQIDEAVAPLDIELTEDEVRTLEAPYTPRFFEDSLTREEWHEKWLSEAEVLTEEQTEEILELMDLKWQRYADQVSHLVGVAPPACECPPCP